MPTMCLAAPLTTTTNTQGNRHGPRRPSRSSLKKTAVVGGCGSRRHSRHSSHSTVKRSSIGNGSAKRSVKFAPKVRLKRIPALSSYTLKEIDELWYTREEVDTITYIADSLVLQAEDSPEGTSRLDFDGESIRGLERKTQDGHTEAFVARVSVYAAVMDEQLRQRSISSTRRDVEELSQLSCKVTEASKSAALERAKQDEANVQVYLHATRTVTAMNTKSTTTKNLKKKAALGNLFNNKPRSSRSRSKPRVVSIKTNEPSLLGDDDEAPTDPMDVSLNSLGSIGSDISGPAPVDKGGRSLFRDDSWISRCTASTTSLGSVTDLDDSGRSIKSRSRGNRNRVVVVSKIPPSPPVSPQGKKVDTRASARAARQAAYAKTRKSEDLAGEEEEIPVLREVKKTASGGPAFRRRSTFKRTEKPVAPGEDTALATDSPPVSPTKKVTKATRRTSTYFRTGRPSAAAAAAAASTTPEEETLSPMEQAAKQVQQLADFDSSSDEDSTAAKEAPAPAPTPAPVRNRRGPRRTSSSVHRTPSMGGPRSSSVASSEMEEAAKAIQQLVQLQGLDDLSSSDDDTTKASAKKKPEAVFTPEVPATPAAARVNRRGPRRTSISVHRTASGRSSSAASTDMEANAQAIQKMMSQNENKQVSPKVSPRSSKRASVVASKAMKIPSPGVVSSDSDDENNNKSPIAAVISPTGKRVKRRSSGYRLTARGASAATAATATRSSLPPTLAVSASSSSVKIPSLPTRKLEENKKTVKKTPAPAKIEIPAPLPSPPSPSVSPSKNNKRVYRRASSIKRMNKLASKATSIPLPPASGVLDDESVQQKKAAAAVKVVEPAPAAAVVAAPVKKSSTKSVASRSSTRGTENVVPALPSPSHRRPKQKKADSTTATNIAAAVPAPKVFQEEEAAAAPVAATTAEDEASLNLLAGQDLWDLLTAPDFEVNLEATLAMHNSFSSESDGSSAGDVENRSPGSFFQKKKTQLEEAMSISSKTTNASSMRSRRSVQRNSTFKHTDRLASSSVASEASSAKRVSAVAAQPPLLGPPTTSTTRRASTATYKPKATGGSKPLTQTKRRNGRLSLHCTAFV